MSLLILNLCIVCWYRVKPSLGFFILQKGSSLVDIVQLFEVTELNVNPPLSPSTRQSSFIMSYSNFSSLPKTLHCVEGSRPAAITFPVDKVSRKTHRR